MHIVTQIGQLARNLNNPIPFALKKKMHPAVPVHFPASGTTSHMGLLSNLLLYEVEGKVCLLSSQVSPLVCTAIEGNAKVGILQTQWRLVLTI